MEVMFHEENRCKLHDARTKYLDEASCKGVRVQVASKLNHLHPESFVVTRYM